MYFSSNGLSGPGKWRKIVKQGTRLRAARLSQTATDYALVNGAKSTKKLFTLMPHWLRMVREPRRIMKNAEVWVPAKEQGTTARRESSNLVPGGGVEPPRC